MNRRLFLGTTLAASSTAVFADDFLAGAAGAPTGAATRGRYPNVLLTAHDGRRLRFYDDIVRGDKLNIINMMYTQCPEICGGTMANLGRVQALLADRMGKDVFIWSITLDPRHDKPAVLQRYAELVGAGHGWTLLSGRPVDIERIRRAVGYVDVDPTVDRDPARHIGMLRIGNDALDRWMSAPGMAGAKRIAQEALWIGLAHRARGEATPAA